jgi:hypothetical protein
VPLQAENGGIPPANIARDYILFRFFQCFFENLCVFFLKFIKFKSRAIVIVSESGMKGTFSRIPPVTDMPQKSFSVGFFPPLYEICPIMSNN